MDEAPSDPVGIERSTRCSGVVLAVCIGPGGIPKAAVESARVDDDGLEGDRHRFPRHGGKHRAVCLFSIEDYRALQADGVRAVEPGAFGENVLTEGVDFSVLRPGDRLELGREVLLEIDDVRAPCGTLKEIDHRFPNLMLGRSGVVCRVLRGGELRPGMAVRSISKDPAGDLDREADHASHSRRC